MSSLPLKFNWTPQKANWNLRKHSVSFSEAQTVFGDPHAILVDDPDHSIKEAREIAIGYLYKNRVLFVSLTQRGDVVWLISARKATPAERKAYEDQA
jgi:uncharacterized protein